MELKRQVMEEQDRSLDNLFVKTGEVDRNLAKHYTDLFEKRNKGDYNDFFDYDEETVKRLFPLTKEFISTIEKIVADS